MLKWLLYVHVFECRVWQYPCINFIQRARFSKLFDFTVVWTFNSLNYILQMLSTFRQIIKSSASRECFLSHLNNTCCKYMKFVKIWWNCCFCIHIDFLLFKLKVCITCRETVKININIHLVAKYINKFNVINILSLVFFSFIDYKVTKNVQTDTLHLYIIEKF